jgi:DNA polymerase I-like protein with 3'-5' exonuclease and polymerase domains
MPLHTHDELVAEVPEKDADEAEALMTKVMSATPEWLPGCPIGVEVKRVYKYEK